MKHHLKISLVLFVALLSACANLTFDQRLQAGYKMNTAVRDTATLALNGGKLTSDQGQNVLEITDRTRKLLDTAAGGDERGLALAMEVLQALKKETP